MRNRTWRVVNMHGDQQVPVVVRAGPFGPSGNPANRPPAQDQVVKMLSNGDLVEQFGHSKKVRGYKVMPVRPAGGEEQWEGWVAQRLIDKGRDREEAWFE